MRTLLLVALVPCLSVGTRARAQADSAARLTDSARLEIRQVERNVQRTRDYGALADVLDRVRDHPLMPRIASASAVTAGNLTIEAGRVISGPVAVFEGTLTVLGRIDGDAVALGGDVVVGQGGEVTGNAIAVEGEVRRAGGTIGGEARTLGGVITEGQESPISDKARATGSSIGLALSWLCVLLIIGVGVLVFAQPYLEGVVDTLETRFWRSFAMGLAGELAAIPVLLLMIVALAITVIGVLLIPFAIVAYVLALAGLVTLGFVAIARLTGGALGSDAVRRLSARGSALRGVVIGTLLLLGVWIAAAALSAVPVLGLALRGIAVTVTFVAVTAGLGATILSRAGTRGVAAPAAKPVDPAVWQTPTPVTGVAAARRPTASRTREPV
ncbi:MAG: hypothetical protein ACT4P6_03820 [Gemmatimonadaceae bacterium]